MKHISYIILTLGACFLSSCADNSEFDTHLSNIPTIANGHTLCGEMTVQSVESESLDPATTRTTATYTDQTGMTYTWEAGVSIPAYIYAEQNGTRQAFEGEINIVTAKPAKFTIKLPEALDPSKGGLKIAVALGKQHQVENGAWATGIDAHGNVNFANSDMIYTNDASSINIPLYAPLTPVAPNGAVNLDMKQLGCFVQVNFNCSKSLTLDEFTIKSDAISGSGTLNLSSTTVAAPAWTPTTTRVATSCYGLDNLTMGNGQTHAHFFTWLMPTADASHPASVPTVLRIGNSATGQYYSRGIPQTFYFVNPKNYSIDINVPDDNHSADLMITEFGSHPKYDGTSLDWIEITNTTGYEVNLANYYLVRAVNGASNMAAGIINLGTLAAQRGVTVVRPDHNTTSLPSGASLIITGSKAGNSYFSGNGLSGMVYQALLMGDNSDLVREFTPTAHTDGRLYNAYFITRFGTDITNGRPNDVVDNFGRFANGRINQIDYNRTYLRRPYYRKTHGTNGIHAYDYTKTMGYADATGQPTKDFDVAPWTFCGKLAGGDLGIIGLSGVGFSMPKVRVFTK